MWQKGLFVVKVITQVGWRVWLMGMVLLLGLVCCGLGFVFILKSQPFSSLPDREGTQFGSFVSPPPLASPQIEIWIEVNGAVKQPGLFKVPSESRLGQVIEKAGGFRAEADTTYIAQQLSLAERLVDGVKIYVPFKNEDISGLPYNQPTTNSSTFVSSDVISLNTANTKQLQELPGIGEVKSQQIIDQRPFTDVYELVTKKIISQNQFDELQNSIGL